MRGRSIAFSFMKIGMATAVLMLAGCVSTKHALLDQTTLLFTVQGAAQMHAGESSHFIAKIGGTLTSNVKWAVNGTNGGSAATGTIDSKGNYTAPTVVPTTNPISISASDKTTAQIASLSVTLLQLIPAITSASLISTDQGQTGVLTVHASALGSNAILMVNGSAVQSAQPYPDTLTATVTGISLSAPIPVSIENQGPGAQTSAAQYVSLQLLATTARAAARLLSQTTFGFTASMIQNVQTMGLGNYLDQQLAQPGSTLNSVPSVLPDWAASNASNYVNGNWWHNVFSGQDQLRQRVAFALSEIFVVSIYKDNPKTLPLFLNELSKDSFGNWRDLMKDVTLTPAMGQYLDMARSPKPSAGQLANENYAREMMQLFSLGVNQINMDGTPVLDSAGNPIPNYTDAQVQAFARAYTGWWPQSSAADGGLNEPMVAVESQHDSKPKILLGGTVLPAGQTTDQDLDGALDNLFEQDSLPPFICRQLIQHLVTSNPSPSYLQRVSNVFVNDGKGVRGNMQAVIRAILMDQEARELDDPGLSRPDFGHLQEPLLWMPQALIGIGFTTNASDPLGNWNDLFAASVVMAEPAHGAQSVFSYFAPQTLLPDSEALLAPEFGIENSNSVASRLDVASRIIDNKLANLTIDLSSTSSWGKLAASPSSLLDQINTVFFAGSMSAEIRADILSAVTPMQDNSERARTAVYLALTSSAFKNRQ
jgi:uncharacterized protein (DUF1800 family)